MKLDVNIFSHPKIKRIRRLPEGDSIFTLWIYILCEGMKNTDNPGVIEMTYGVPVSDEDITHDTSIKIDTVRLAIETFLNLGMIIIEPNCNGAMSVKNMRKHQSIDELEYKKELNRRRVQAFRDKKKILEIENKSADVMHYSNECNGGIEKNRIDKNRKEKNNTCALFNKFWDMYDYKKNRHKCVSKWNKLNTEDKDNIFKSLPIYIKSTPDKQYRKHPITYLNNRSWEDEIIENTQQKTLSQKVADREIDYSGGF
jgi:predicted phage replisome organizer